MSRRSSTGEDSYSSEVLMRTSQPISTSRAIAVSSGSTPITSRTVGNVVITGEAEEVAIRAEPIEGRIEDHVRRTFEGYPQIQSDVALWGVGDLVERKP